MFHLSLCYVNPTHELAFPNSPRFCQILGNNHKILLKNSVYLFAQQTGLYCALFQPTLSCVSPATRLNEAASALAAATKLLWSNPMSSSDQSPDWATFHIPVPNVEDSFIQIAIEQEERRGEERCRWSEYVDKWV